MYTWWSWSVCSKCSCRCMVLCNGLDQLIKFSWKRNDSERIRKACATKSGVEVRTRNHRTDICSRRIHRVVHISVILTVHKEAIKLFLLHWTYMTKAWSTVMIWEASTVGIRGFQLKYVLCSEHIKRWWHWTLSCACSLWHCASICQS